MLSEIVIEILHCHIEPLIALILYYFSAFLCKIGINRDHSLWYITTKQKKMADENILIQIGRNRDLSLWYSNNKTQKKMANFVMCAI